MPSNKVVKCFHFWTASNFKTTTCIFQFTKLGSSLEGSAHHFVLPFFFNTKTTAMSGLTAFLQTELLTLSSEARRKHPEIKEVSKEEEGY